MKLRELKGIANNLCGHLDSAFTFGEYKKVKLPLELDIITSKSELAQHCLSFIKENIKPPFDLDRIKKVVLKIKKLGELLTVKVTIKVDDKEFTGGAASITYNPELPN